MTADDQRAERALRAALHRPAGGTPAVDAAQIRRRVRRRRVGAAAGAVAAVLLLAAVAVPRLTGGNDAVVARPSPASADRWRTEQYRGIEFTVPAGWGYADAPAADWCADSRNEKRIRRPYVSLGGRTVVRAISCGPLPASRLSEHVEVSSYPAAAEVVPGAVRRNGWWLVTAVSGMGADAVVVTAVSKDEALARRIAGSAVPAVDPPCAPTSPVQQLGARPTATGTGEAGGALMLCQYDPGEEGGLRARFELDAAASRDLRAALTEAPAAPTAPCSDDPGAEPEIAVTIGPAGSRASRPTFVAARGCERGPAALQGGFDDGRSVRSLTPDICAHLLVGPIRLEATSRGLAAVCRS